MRNSGLRAGVNPASRTSGPRCWAALRSSRWSASLLLGIRSWLVLGMVSFVLEFVPYVGPFLAAVPGIVTGFAVSSDMALRVGSMYLGVQLVESYVLQP